MSQDKVHGRGSKAEALHSAGSQEEHALHAVAPHIERAQRQEQPVRLDGTRQGSGDKGWDAQGYQSRHSYVFKQPETEEDIALCMEALEGCPVEAIGEDGDKPDA